ncbi:hypothetical protein R1flu_014430 [Riccia fluitans]|uniref:Uncharacterized protein n=1 Tax=Riccia fluitans TaxID=41844 RepID=A0ABD1YH64_9MARC
MSGIRRHSRRQSDVPSEKLPSQHHRRATSPIYKLPHDEAMETIDLLVHDEETNFGVGAIVEKISTLQSMAMQLVVRTRLPHPPIVGFEELSLLTRDEISFRLNHKNEDRASIAKFREDWQAVVQLLHIKFLARMARQNQEGPLLLGDEPWNASSNTQAQWDAERCELVCERDQLKEDLLKAQDILADATQREKALRAEHERLQEEYS